MVNGLYSKQFQCHISNPHFRLYRTVLLLVYYSAIHLFSTVCFKIFDSDHDGLLSESELRCMIEAMIIVRQENCTVDEKVRII